MPVTFETLWAYHGLHDDELDVEAGAVLELVSSPDADWSLCFDPVSQTQGLIPASYLKQVAADDAPPAPPLPSRSYREPAAAAAATANTKAAKAEAEDDSLAELRSRLAAMHDDGGGDSRATPPASAAAPSAQDLMQRFSALKLRASGSPMLSSDSPRPLSDASSAMTPRAAPAEPPPPASDDEPPLPPRNLNLPLPPRLPPVASAPPPPPPDVALAALQKKAQEQAVAAALEEQRRQQQWLEQQRAAEAERARLEEQSRQAALLLAQVPSEPVPAKPAPRRPSAVDTPVTQPRFASLAQDVQRQAIALENQRKLPEARAKYELALSYYTRALEAQQIPVSLMAATLSAMEGVLDCLSGAPCEQRPQVLLIMAQSGYAPKAKGAEKRLAAMAADRAGEFAKALELYKEAIEYLFAHRKAIAAEPDVNKAIGEMMDRAELLKKALGR